MAMNSSQVEAIVKQVLEQLSGSQPVAPAASACSKAIPKTAHVAMLTGIEKVEIKEYPMPEVGDDDILVKVEGCGICGTDAHEYKRDPFGLIPVALGHEGTGEIVKMGKNVKKDSAGKDVRVGDKIVTCMIFKDDPDITMFDLNKQNVGNGAEVYGLVPDDENVVVATNQGETLIGNTSPAGYAYQNICERIIGKEVPFMNLEKGFSFWTKFNGIFHRA